MYHTEFKIDIICDLKLRPFLPTLRVGLIGGDPPRYDREYPRNRGFTFQTGFKQVGYFRAITNEFEYMRINYPCVNFFRKSGWLTTRAIRISVSNRFQTGFSDVPSFLPFFLSSCLRVLILILFLFLSFPSLSFFFSCLSSPIYVPMSHLEKAASARAERRTGRDRKERKSKGKGEERRRKGRK